MKAIRIITVILFIAILLVPILTFNFQEDAVSLIDNRMLTANPFSAESFSSGGALSDYIENYVNDRIGFRDEMILAYTVLNDQLFHKMVHPSYVYGTDGYVFGAGITVNHPYTPYHEAFADMVKKLQDYCGARNVPFLFAFNPAKPAVLSEHLPVGINYDRAWVDAFFAALDARQVRYVDNTQLLREKAAAGEAVFNQKYDANHWSDLGAYYGTNAMLAELQKSIPTIHVNTPDELTFGEELKTSLPVSEFPIHEMVPAISIQMSVNGDKGPAYAKELYLHPSYDSFGYFTNEARMTEGAPKALVFQGSYMNKFGYKYLANGFSEYVYVHDYQNVLNFPYYFNIFQPDCVIFEVAEYTFSDRYFPYDAMCAMDLNPLLETAERQAAAKQEQPLDMETVSVERGDTLTKLIWTAPPSAAYAWMRLDRVYDMKKTENGYEVTVPTRSYDQCQSGMEMIVSQGGTMTTYTA